MLSPECCEEREIFPRTDKQHRRALRETNQRVEFEIHTVVLLILLWSKRTLLSVM